MVIKYGWRSGIYIFFKATLEIIGTGLHNLWTHAYTGHIICILGLIHICDSFLAIVFKFKIRRVNKRHFNYKKWRITFFNFFLTIFFIGKISSKNLLQNTFNQSLWKINALFIHYVAQIDEILTKNDFEALFDTSCHQSSPISPT